ncbi:MAG: chemotaxis protein CheX [Lachnospiraceae bacterium]|nr:chemotaxis protein CheX [Lachnospiraceae bacterium]
MAAINADHLNVFLMATSKILQDMCGFNPKIGKPAVSKLEFSDDTIVIMIGVTGEMRGQVMLSFEDPIACDIAGKMMMMPVQELDEISTSAICELGNMIMGNASTVFSVEGIGIDITPPTMCKGNVSFQGPVANLKIPVFYDGEKKIDLNIAMKKD